MTHPLSSEVGILGLLLTGISSVHGIVLFKLHGLHLLLDGVHCDVVGGAGERDKTETKSLMITVHC